MTNCFTQTPESLPDLKAEKYHGLLLGAITGDCLGLPFEMLSPGRKNRIFGPQISHRFLFIPSVGPVGICSDDTEHLWLTGLALAKTRGAGSDAFGRELAGRLKSWLLTCPIGIGRATLLSCLKLWAGINYRKSGFRSAGNGAAIRAVIIGAYYANDWESMLSAVRVSTLMTHTDPRAFEGALAMALAAAAAMDSNPECAPAAEFFQRIFQCIEGEELVQSLRSAEKHLAANSSLADYLKQSPVFEKGISGYINHTVPAVIYAWLRYYGDYRETVGQIIAAGGDADTTAALAGALAGVTVGRPGIPAEWLAGVRGWPLSLAHLRQLGQALADPGAIERAVPHNILFLFRNILSLPIFGWHIIRRLVCFGSRQPW